MYVARPGRKLEVAAIDVQSGERRPRKVPTAMIFKVVISRNAASYAYSYVRPVDELYVADGLK